MSDALGDKDREMDPRRLAEQLTKGIDIVDPREFAGGIQVVGPARDTALDRTRPMVALQLGYALAA